MRQLSSLSILSLLIFALACGDDDGGADTGREDTGIDVGVDAPGEDTVAQDTVAQDTNGQDTSGSDALEDVSEDAPVVDRGMACPSTFMCNPVTNVSCESGEACYFGFDGDGNGDGFCIAEGAAARGEACGGISECADGLACVGGECREPCCDGNDSDCSEGGLCLGGITDEDVVGFCIFPDDCSVVEQTGCGDEACYPFNSTTRCYEPGDAEIGEACSSPSACVAGSTCVVEDGEGVCRGACDTSAGADACGDDLACAALTDRDDNLGVCVSPS